jgi:hypothetical protein
MTKNEKSKPISKIFCTIATILQMANSELHSFKNGLEHQLKNNISEI